MSFQQLTKKLNALTVEELGNTLTHGFGLLLSVAGLILLVILAKSEGDIWHFISVFIYGGSLIALYSASTLYHGATSPKLKERLQLIDHCCIYVLIAGSYTPFTLVALRGSFGTGLFIFVWFFALIGIIAKVFFHKRFRAASVISYLVMGWIGIIVIQPIFMKLGLAPLVLVVAGGIAYSLGTIFYGWENLRHHHAVWHLFVLAGSILHFLAISIYVIPYVAKL
jgi:hemolysin III